MKQIALTGKRGVGKFAVVDDDFVVKYKYYLESSGYPRRCKYDKNKRMKHMALHHDVIGFPPKGLLVDHINGNPLDNRRDNLRFCTSGQNNMNFPMFKKNKTGYKGVIFVKGKYHANIGFNRKYIYLGRFKTAKEAAKKYNYFAKHLFGEFARLNKV